MEVENVNRTNTDNAGRIVTRGKGLAKAQTRELWLGPPDRTL